MDHSVSKTCKMNCPACGAALTADFWQVIDFDQRPDLLESMCSGELEEIQCPHCQQVSATDASILVYRSRGGPFLIFAFAADLSLKAAVDQAMELENVLSLKLAADHIQPPGNDTLRIVPRQYLSTVIAQWDELSTRLYVEESTRDFQRRLRAEMEVGLKRQPENPFEDSNDSRQALEALRNGVAPLAPSVRDALFRFLELHPWSELRQILEETPELLSPEVDQSLELLIAVLRALDSQEEADFNKGHQLLLQRCGQVGIAEAFRERMGLPLDELAGWELYAELSEMSPSLVSALAEPAALLVETGSVQGFNQLLEERPNLRKRINEATWPEQVNRVPDPLSGAVERALSARSLWQRDGSEVSLGLLIQEWEIILQDPSINDTPSFQDEVLGELAGCYLDRFRFSNDLRDLDQAVGMYENLLPHGRDATSRWGMAQHNLSVALVERFEITGNVKDLDAAAAAAEEAAACMRVGSASWIMAQNSLGALLRTRFDAMGKTIDIERAIAVHRETIGACVVGTEDWAKTYTHLAIALLSRFDALGDAKNLGEAIDALDRALHILKVGSAEWVSAESTWGTAVLKRYKLTRTSVADLQAALDAFEQVCWTVKTGSREWGRQQSNLASVLGMIAEVTGDTAYWSRALEAHNKALSTTRVDSPDWGHMQFNLAIDAIRQFDRFHESSDRSTAIRCLQEALRAFPQQVFPQHAVAAALPLGCLLIESRIESDMQQAVKVYADIEDAVQYLYFERIYETQRGAYLRKIQDFSANYAYALARAGQLRQAVEVLEGGRARSLAEVLSVQKGLDSLVDSAERDKLERAWYQVRDAESEYSHVGLERRPEAEKKLVLARHGHYVLLREQFPQFFLTPAFAEIHDAAEDGPIVYLLSTSAGSLALIVRYGDEGTQGDVEAVWLDSMSTGELRKMLLGDEDSLVKGGYLGTYSRWRRDSRNPVRRLAWKLTLDQVTRQLWGLLVGPVVDHLTGAFYTSGRTTADQAPEHLGGNGALSAKFVPLGWLSLLPLHAAWTDALEMPGGRYYALDAVSFVYVPSARALITARRLAQNVLPDHLLLVVEPIPVAASRLPHATEEAMQVLTTWGDEKHITRWRASATYEEVHEQLSEATVFHFDGHAFAGWGEPLAGGLLLANNRILSVADLQRMQLEMRLAVLSACETGVVGTNLPDEVIGLPSALIQAGTAGVVASLWSVTDQSTALLMAAFYKYWKQEGLTPVAALRQAQLELRQNPDFGHPFYWAAFTYTGA
jgi:hypothetical protein